MSKSAYEVYEHYGINADKVAVEKGELEGIDFLVGKEEDIKELTRDMAGFGTDCSQRVTIEYDKGYGYFLVKRSSMDYGNHGIGKGFNL